MESYDRPILLTLNEKIRERLLTILDQSFASTHVLVLLEFLASPSSAT